MRVRRLCHNSKCSLRRGFVAAAVLAYFGAAIGVPLPSGGGKDRSVPFPCMDRPCGCHDARGCQEHCCCFTSEQKLAWAAEHQVDPTPFVDFAALAAVRPADGVTTPDHLATCCTHRADEPECAARQGDQQLAAAPHVCLTHPVAPSGTGIPQATESPEGDDSAVSIAAYRTCHGLAPLWSILSAALPPPRPMAYEFAWNAGESVVSAPISAVTVALSPPTPPPRG